MGSRRAMARASSVFPDPVAPTSAAMGGGIGGGRGARCPGGAIGLIDLDEALDLGDAGGSPALPIGFDEDRVQRHRALPHLEPRG